MALNEHDHDWRRQLRRYPGRAGVLHAFLDCIVHRAWVGQRLPRNVHLYELSPIIERLSFAAWMRAPTDRIPVAHVQDLLADSDFAEQRLVPVEAARAWQNAQDVALRVGILLPSETHGDYRFPHQQFCEYFAGRHFATRLRLAAKRRCFDAELWELLGVRHHDSVTSYALEVLAGDPKGQQLVTRAFRILSSSDDDASLSFIARVGGGLAYNWLVGPATREGASLPALNALAELGGTSACNALKSMADDLTRSCEDRWAATAALCRVAPALGMENLKQLWGEFQDSQPDGAWFMIAYLITEVDYDASASFLEQLARAGTTPALLRVRIMTHLLAHGHIAAPAMLAELAQDSGVSPVLRRAALGPLFESQPEAGHALIPALRKQEGELTDIDRHEIAQLHMQVDAALAMDLLEEVCRDRWASVHVRVDAASDLVRADPMRGARCLRDMCEDTHDHYLCLSAARALAQGDEHSATRVLETLYEDEAIELRWRVRAASILSDVKSGWTVPYERLRTWLADGTDVSAQDICALTRVWHARVVMDCKISPTVRRLVLQDWVRAAGRSVADTLRRLSGTRDEHPDVRKAAIEALVRLQGDAIGPFMLKLIEEEDNEAVRQALVGECISLVPEDVLVRVFAERTRARGAQEKQWIRHAKEWGGAVSSGKIEWSRIEHVAKGTNVSTDILNVMASHAGRRVLSPTYAEKIGPQVQERERLLAAPTSAAGATHTKRMNKELVMAMYLVDCTNHGRQPTLRDAEVWSQEFGQPWKRSALRETEPWKRHMSTVGSREEYKRDIMKALLHSWREEE
ncbi:MAG: HEAT repeat domain-containing protein [Phycisphaerae bacterium]|nr:HEAT repeat domain-containing protein [Phycisphaerae bacterium]